MVALVVIGIIGGSFGFWAINFINETLEEYEKNWKTILAKLQAGDADEVKRLKQISHALKFFRKCCTYNNHFFF